MNLHSVFSFLLITLLSGLIPPSKAEIPSEHFAQAHSALKQAIANLEQLRKQTKESLSSNDTDRVQSAIQALLNAETTLKSKERISIDGDQSRLNGLLYDIRHTLAETYIKLGDREKAIAILESTNDQAIAPYIRTLTENDESYLTIRADKRFQNYLDIQNLPGLMGKNSPIGASFQATISLEQRIAGLSLFWANARRSFVNINRLPGLNWDEIYMKFLPEVIAAKTTKDYYEVLMRLAPLLNDSHTNIYPPDELADTFFSRPPIMTGKIGEQILILEVRSAELRKHLSIGEEILKIDGQDVHEYVASHVSPYVSSSTPQDRDVREYFYQLLAGDTRTPVSLTLRDAEGKVHEETLRRGAYKDIEARKIFNFVELPDNIAYLSLDHFQSDEGAKAFVATLPQILASTGLILDLRRNGGGSTENGYKILSYLTRDPIPFPTSIKRAETGFDLVRGDIMMWSPISSSGNFIFPHNEIYSGPVVVLTGPQTISAAEDFLVAFNVMRRGKIIGGRSAGSTGSSYSFRLPGGGSARICVKRDTYPDGKQFVGTGITPDIEVNPTAHDIRSGYDAALNEALSQLKEYQKHISETKSFHEF